MTTQERRRLLRCVFIKAAKRVVSGECGGGCYAIRYSAYYLGAPRNIYDLDKQCLSVFELFRPEFARGHCWVYWWERKGSGKDQRILALLFCAAMYS